MQREVFVFCKNARTNVVFILQSEATQIGEVKADQKDVYFLRQFIGNACGTIGLIHAILNNKESLGLSGNVRKLQRL